MSAKWAIRFGLCLIVSGLGCSMSSTGRNSRPVPLPPGVNPSDLSSTTPPLPVQLVDARPYYVTDSTTTVAPQKSPYNHAPAPRRSEFAPLMQRMEFRKQAIEKENNEKQKNLKKQKTEELNNKVESSHAEVLLHYATTILDQKVGPTLNLLSNGAYEKNLNSKAIKESRNLSIQTQLNETEYEEVQKRIANFKNQRELVEKETPPALVKPGAKHDILILSGGGSRSLYLYGVVCGWSDSGTMPNFSVVTGVSGGAMAAATVFAGPEFLTDLRQIFFKLDQQHLLTPGGAWHRKRFPHPFGIGSDSIADTGKIRTLLESVTRKPNYFPKIIAEHAKGRRLYIGTTNLDTQRFVVWDMGAIATEGTPEAYKMYEDILLASAAIPPLMQPSHIKVTIDGKQYDEMHVDGGTTRNLFFYPPSDWPGDVEDAKTHYQLLAGARVHVILGGKVYEEPEGTPNKVVQVGMRGLGTILSSLQRAEVARIYSDCISRDMSMRLAAIPLEYGQLPAPSVFDPVQSQKLFCSGYTRAQDGTAWGDPPERAVSEDSARRGATLTSEATGGIGTIQPVRPGSRRIIGNR